MSRNDDESRIDLDLLQRWSGQLHIPGLHGALIAVTAVRRLKQAASEAAMANEEIQNQRRDEHRVNSGGTSGWSSLN